MRRYIQLVEGQYLRFIYRVWSATGWTQDEVSGYVVRTPVNGRFILRSGTHTPMAVYEQAAVISWI